MSSSGQRYKKIKKHPTLHNSQHKSAVVGIACRSVQQVRHMPYGRGTLPHRSHALSWPKCLCKPRPPHTIPLMPPNRLYSLASCRYQMLPVLVRPSDTVLASCLYLSYPLHVSTEYPRTQVKNRVTTKAGLLLQIPAFTLHFTSSCPCFLCRKKSHSETVYV